MRIFIASDHAGFDLKKSLIEYLEKQNIKITDLGTDNSESCDYPIFANEVVECLSAVPSEKNFGILICGTGIGMSIAANRYQKIRAALCFNEKMAIMSRRHNDANILVLGAKIIDYETARNCVKAFLETDFEKEERHIRRLKMIEEKKAEGKVWKSIGILTVITDILRIIQIIKK